MTDDRRTAGPASPRITDDAWGRIEVEPDLAFKDAKLFPGGAREWDWNETGTEHEPGIQPADVEELLDHGADMIVLSRGRNRRLLVMRETLRLLEERGVEAHVLPTDQAIAMYNRLAESGAAGALIHSTC